MMKNSDQFWEDLLAFIKEGRVIPVVGERAVTFDASDTVLCGHLALDLARRLKIAVDRLGAVPTFTDVACEWLVNGGRSSEMYKHLYYATKSFFQEGHTCLAQCWTLAFQMA